MQIRMYVLLLFLPLFTVAQSDTLRMAATPGKQGPDSAELQCSQVIVSYLMKNVGRKVGNGICRTLIDSCFGQTGLQPEKWTHEKYWLQNFYQVDTSKQEILPGDIILYDKVIFADGTITHYHCAFVYDVYTDNKIAVAEQNANGIWLFNLRRSRVVINERDFSQVISGNIYILRLKS